MISYSSPRESRRVRTSSTLARRPLVPCDGPLAKNHFWYRKPSPFSSTDRRATASGSTELPRQLA